jgi:hypothetical protein
LGAGIWYLEKRRLMVLDFKFGGAMKEGVKMRTI